MRASRSIPAHTGALVGGGVGKALGLAGLAAEEPVKVRALLVALRPVDLVALQALGLEGLRARLRAPLGDRHLRHRLGHL